VIVLTGPSDDDAITRCKDLHAYYVHKSDDTWDDLEPLIFEILMSTPEPRIVAEAQPTTSPRVLLVDDDPVGLIGRGAAAFIARPLDVTSLVAEARRHIALPVYA
jgi:hypothetical protein